jgi:hypothetical protein
MRFEPLREMIAPLHAALFVAARQTLPFFQRRSQRADDGYTFV